MNNKTILTIAFLMVGTLFTATMAMVPAYAGGDDDDDHKSGDGNKQKVDDESAGAIADCDYNEVERSDFDCFASAATDDSEVKNGEDGRDGNGRDGNGRDGNGRDGNGRDGNGDGNDCLIRANVLLEAGTIDALEAEIEAFCSENPDATVLDIIAEFTL